MEKEFIWWNVHSFGTLKVRWQTLMESGLVTLQENVLGSPWAYSPFAQELLHTSRRHSRQIINIHIYIYILNIEYYNKVFMSHIYMYIQNIEHYNKVSMSHI